MNIFIDSNILYQDYFFENKSPKNILDYAKKGLIKLYMSDIVRRELKWQFQKEVEEKNREICKINKDTTRLKLENTYEEININDQLRKFDEFYSELERLESFSFIPVQNNFLPDIIDRAIQRKKPFTAEKTELKDALIWKSYAEYVEINNLDNCILLTNNTSDFCSKNDKNKVHHELLRDTDKFEVINSSFEFIKTKSSILESPAHKFQIYISKFDFKEENVFKLILHNFDSKIIKKTHAKVENMSPNAILRDDFWYDGYVTCDDVDIINCEDIEYEILTDRALISGRVIVSCESECYNYNPVRDSGEDQYSFISEHTLLLEIYFNFDLKENEECSDFEITDIFITVAN